MFANKMLITSLFSSLLFSIWMVIIIESILYRKFEAKGSLPKRIMITIGRVIGMAIFIIIFKKLIATQIQEDDSHIWDILKSKLIEEFNTFDTRLYTCAKEFDFIEMETYVKLTKTGLLVISFLMFFFNVALAFCKIFFIFKSYLQILVFNPILY